MSEVQLHSFFITPFFVKKIEMDNNKMIQKLYDLKSQNKTGTPRSNVGGWHSNLNLYEEDEFKEITGVILQNAKECFEHLDAVDDCNPTLDAMWGIINQPGSRNNIHTHPMSFLSGVYYMKIPEKSGRITFLDPRPQAEIMDCNKKTNQSIHLAHSVDWNPEENSLIFFPSWLQHQVATNLSNEDRVILSFNLMWTGG